jgi:hypothetical protein
MRTRSSIAFAILCAALAPAQVLSPAEIADPAIRALQQSHLDELHAITAALAKHEFPYHFYFSRKLDLTEKVQERNDQRSIQFDKFQGQIVLKITGNYFAAYSTEKMTSEERTRRTYTDVMLPILQAAVPALARADVPQAFALEISHHIIRKVMGLETETAENVVLILPKAAAQRLVDARDEASRIAALQDGAAYLNSNPISIFPYERREIPVVRVASLSPVPVTPVVTAVPSAVPPPIPSSRAKLEDAYRDTFARLLKDLDSQAHFVPYAPPSFIAFREGRYLELPINTPLAASDSGSQYKLAALAFDRHVAHLIRPVLAYFKDSADFTGVDFSTTVRLAGSAEGEASESVEFILPLSALRTYSQYNLTGQQLLDAGVVLINGERVGLDLQTAEAQGTASK